MENMIKKARKLHMGKRGLAFTLAVLMVITSVNWPDNVLSAWADEPAICENHTSHEETCGYVEAVEGIPCSHVCDETCVSQELICEKTEHTHTDDCYVTELTCEATEHTHTEACYTLTLTCTDESEEHVHTDACYTSTLACELAEHEHADACYNRTLVCETEEHTHTDECYTIINQCQHVHSEECGYVEAVEGQPCNHSCELCEVSENEEETGSEEETDARITALTERVNALPTEEEIQTYDEAQKEELLAELNEIGELLDSYYEEELIDDELYTEMYMALIACNEALIESSAATLAEVTAEVDNSSSYIPTQIINGGFETNPYTGQQYNGIDGGWNTTESDYSFEWMGMTIGGWNLTNNYGVVDNGSVYAVEMNNNNAATLYQDLTTNGGDVIRWTLQHAARSIGDNPQTMEVQVGKPVGTSVQSGGIPTGINASINTNIVAETKVTYSYNSVQNPENNTYGYGNSDEIKWLSVPMYSSNNQWYTAKGVYIIPSGQTVTRFAFVSTSGTNPGLGNLLDNVTFSTLIGNLHATTDHNGVTVTGYWGETDTSKKLVVKFDDTHISNIDMSSVVGKNFKITIPTANIPDGARLVDIYHEDYASAKKTVEIHNWSFSSSANVITATCDITGCSSPTATSTLSASNATYTGSPVKASVSTTGDFPVSVSENNIIYYLSDGTTKTTSTNSGASAEGKAPVKVGSYIAKISAGGETTEASFEIYTIRLVLGDGVKDTSTFGKFTYPNATVTGTVNKVLITVDSGTFAAASTYTVANQDLTGLSKTYNVSNASEAQALIRSCVFNLGTGKTEQNITVSVSGETTDLSSLPANASITITQHNINGVVHYYAYVQLNSNNDYNQANSLSFSDAYAAAKKLTFNGLQGYLATITSQEENTVLDNITMNMGWGGGGRVSQSNAALNGATFYNNGSLIGPAASSNWYWVCGPEAGQKFTYTGWTTGEPNGGSAASGEYLLMLHKVNYGVYGWNDIDNASYKLPGYFVEWSEDTRSAGETANFAQATAKNQHSHTWNYSASGASIIANCTTEGCPATSINAKLTLTEPTAAIYTGNSIGVTLSKDTAFPLSASTDDVVYYLSDGTTKTTSENSGASAEGKAPVNIGNYVAKITVNEKTAQLSYRIKTNKIASVTIGTKTTYYPSFAAALTAANNASYDCKLTILESCTHSGTATINNVNGKKITLDIGDEDTTLTFTATANSQTLLTVKTDVDFVGDGGKIIFNLNSRNDIKGVYAGQTCTIRMYDGFNILAKDGGTDERIFWIQNGPKCYIYGGSIKIQNIKTASTIVNTTSSLYIYDGDFGWDIIGNGSDYWSGVTDSCEAIAFEIYGGYFNGPLWVGNTYSTEFYKFYGGKFTTNKLKTNQYSKDGTTIWTNYIVNGNTVNNINETKEGVTYLYEIVNPNTITCSAVSENETYGTARVSATRAQKNTSVTFTASAKRGYAFVKWVDEEGNTVSTDANYSKVVTDNTVLKALFEAVELKFDIPVTGSLSNESVIRNADFTFKIEAVTEGAPMPASNTVTVVSPTQRGRANSISGKFTVVDPADGTFEYKITQVTNGVSNCKIDNGTWNVKVDIVNGVATNYIYKYTSPVIENSEQSFNITKQIASTDASVTTNGDSTTLVIGGGNIYNTGELAEMFNTAAIVSDFAVDFTRDFEAKGTFTAGVAADGSVVGFVPDGTPNRELIQGGNLGVYGSSQNRNGIFLEFDTICNGNSALGDQGLGSKHFALMKTNESGSASVVNNQYSNMTTWPTGTGTYEISYNHTTDVLTFKYSVNGNSNTWTYSNPTAHFGTNKAYIILGGSMRRGPGGSYNVPYSGAAPKTEIVFSSFNYIGQKTNYVGVNPDCSFVNEFSCTHDSWNYTANGATITANCADEYCSFANINATMTIAGPASATYNGNAVAATLTKDTTFPGTVTAADIVYYLSDGTTKTNKTNSGAKAVGKAPANGGNYVAKLTIEDATASVSFAINRADQTISAPTALVSNIRTNDVTLVAVVAGNGATKYAVNTVNQAPTDETKWQSETTFTGLYSGMTYYFFAKYEGDSNYNPAVSSSAAIKTVSKPETEEEPGGITPTPGPGADPEDPGEPEIPVGDLPFDVCPGLYDGTPEFPGTPVGEVVTCYYYEGREGTVYGPSEEQPSAVGKYNYVIRMEDSVSVTTKKIPFEITKNDGGDIPGVTPTPGTGADPEDPGVPEIPTGSLPFAPNPDIYSGTPEFPGTPVGEVVTTYTYEGREGTVYGPSATQPTEIGKYYYVITMEDNVTKAVKKIPFEITKNTTGTDTGVDPVPGSGDPENPGTPEIPGGTPWEPYPDLFDGDPMPGFPESYTPTGEVTTTYTYEGRNGTIYGPSAEKPTLAGKYYLVITVEDDVNKLVQKLPFEITKDDVEPAGGGTPTPGPKDPEAPGEPGRPEIPTGELPFDPVPVIFDSEPTLPEPHTGDVVTTYIYEGRDGTTYGPSKIQPTEVGKYNLVVTVEDDVNKTVKTYPFEISKDVIGEDTGVDPVPGSDPSDPDGPSIPHGDGFNPYPDLFDGDPMPGFPEGYTPEGTVTTTYTYEGREGTVYGPSYTKPEAVGKYNLVITVEDDKNRVVEKIPFEITKKETTGSTGVTPANGPGTTPKDPADPDGPKIPDLPGGGNWSPNPDLYTGTPGFPEGYEPDGTVAISHTYEGRDGTEYAVTTIKPTRAGKYNLIVTVEDKSNRVIEKIPFEITKTSGGTDTGVTPKNAPGGPVITCGDDYNPSPDIFTGDPMPGFPEGYTPAGNVVTTYTYEGREGTTYGPTATKPVAAGKYYLVITVEDNVNVVIQKLPFELVKKNSDEVTGTTITSGPEGGEPQDPENPGGPTVPEIPYGGEFTPNPGIYTGTPSFPEGYTPTGDVTTTYTYEGREGTNYGPSATKPTAIGKYYYVITVEDDVTKAVEKLPFAITKKTTGTVDAEPADGPGGSGNPVIPAKTDGSDPFDNPVPGIIKTTPTFGEGTTTQGTATVTYTYEGRDGTVYPENGIPTQVRPTAGGKYNLIITLEDEINKVVKKVPFEISKNGGKDIEGVTPTSGPEGGDPQDPVNNPSGPTIPKIPYDEDFSPVPDIYSGTPSFENGVGEVTTTYTYEGRDGTVYPASGTATTVKPVAPGKYNLIVTFEDDVNSKTVKYPFEIVKGNQAKPVLKSVLNSTGIDYYNELIKDLGNGKITGLDDNRVYEYSVDGGNTWTETAEGADEITSLSAGEVLVRFKETANCESSESITITIGGGAYVEIDNTTFNSVLNTVTFGKFFNKTQTVYVKEAKASHSAVKEVEYYLSDKKETSATLDAVNTWKTYTSLGVKLNPSDNYVAYFKITDTEGEYTYISTNGVVIDSIAPVISGIESGKTYASENAETVFTVEEKYPEKVTYVKTGESETELTGSATSNPEKKSYTLTAGTYEVITATDKAGNTAVVRNVTVTTGENKPSFGTPYKPGDDGTGGTPGDGSTPGTPGTPSTPGTPTTPTYDDGPYVIYPTDSPAPGTTPVIKYDYDSDESGTADVTELDPDYEIYTGPLDDDGNPTVGPLTGDPIKVPTGTPIYIRKKGNPPTTGPSDFVPYTIPNAATTVVYLTTSPVGAGKVSIDLANTNRKKVYTGRDVSISAVTSDEEKFTFSKWIDTETGAELGTDAELTYTAVKANGTVYLTAVFDLVGTEIVTEPTVASGVLATSFNYDGTEHTSIQDSDIPANTTLKDQSVTKATAADTYRFTLVPDEGYKWNDGSEDAKTFTWYIYAATTTKPTVEYKPDDKKIVITTTPDRKVLIKLGTNGTPKEYMPFPNGTGEVYPTDDGNPASDDNPLIPGTYYICVEGDENHKDSPWVPVIIGAETPEIIPAGPTDFNPDPTEVTVNTKLTGTDGVKKIVVRYRKAGTSDWTESTTEIPVSTEISYTLPGAGDVLEADTDYEYKTVIIMEGPTEEDDDDYEIEGEVKKLHTPKKKQGSGAGKGQITTVIRNESSEATKDITITIEKGDVAMASEELTVSAGDQVQSTPVIDLEDGVYNIILRTADGLYVETRSITIESGSVESTEFVIKDGEIKSVVQIEPGAPAVAVDGLADIITAAEETLAKNGKISVEVKLDVKVENSSTAEGAGDLETISASAGESVSLYLDINLYKTITRLNELTGEELYSQTENIGQSNYEVLEIAVPFDTSRFTEVEVLRYHAGVPSKLTSLSARPEGYYVDGTYYVGDGYIFIYASGFSTYGISTIAKPVPIYAGPDTTSDTTIETTTDGKKANTPKTGDQTPRMPADSSAMEAIVEEEEKRKAYLNQETDEEF